jgi:hypothetical protein
MVVDNGSTEQRAKSTTHTIDTNVFFGGGFNVVLDYFLSTNHDYLYFLNNDLVFHGLSFLSTSLKEAIEVDAAVYSPTIINASFDQCYWKQMWNWGIGLRSVKWIDFQSPLIRRDVLEKIKSYPAELVYGWGLDFYTGCICDKYNLSTYVSDFNTIAHMNSLTIKSNKINMTMGQFHMAAETNMVKYFNNSEFSNMYLQLRKYGQEYRP